MTVQRRLKKDKAKNARLNNTIIQQQYIKDFFLFLKRLQGLVIYLETKIYY